MNINVYCVYLVDTALTLMQYSNSVIPSVLRTRILHMQESTYRHDKKD